jgi:peptidoglycan hydrolase-like protein with peptidoglycan-binding domain
MDMSQFRARNEIGFNDIYIIRLAERPERQAERPMGVMDNQARIRQAQRQLQGEGFAIGRIDGVLGPQTRVALQQYQAKRGLPRTGELDEATSRALGVY